LALLKDGCRDERNGKQKSRGIRKNSFNAGELAAKILEKKIVSLLQGEIRLDGMKIYEQGVCVESWNMVERGLMKRPRRRWVGESSSKAAATTTKSIGVRIHFRLEIGEKQRRL
jgi:hypothetical protein